MIDPVKLRRRGRPTKWTDERLCDLWVNIQYQMWARKKKVQPTIQAIMAKRKKWPALEIWRGLGMDDYVEVRVTPQGRQTPDAPHVVNTVRRAYDRAVKLLARDARLRLECFKDLERAKRWHGVKLTVRKKPGSGGSAT